MAGDERAARGRVPGAAAVVLACLTALTGCSLFGVDTPGETVSVFEIRPGDCFRAPAEITAELTDLARVDCTEPHEQEAYALVEYTPPFGVADLYPGDAALKDFADGACAAEFAEYVGVDYRDSQLFFTYLLPSARGWEQGNDRSILCFITTTGEQLTASVAGSEL